MPGFSNGTLYFENGLDPRGTPPVANQIGTDGKLLIGSTAAPFAVCNTLAHADGSITVTNGAGTIDLSGTQATTAQKGSVTLASAAETLVATDASKVITPATLNSMLSQSDLTGFASWSGAGPYFDDTTLGTFQLLRGGTGFIKSKQITWLPQNISGMTAGNTYYIYIDSTGTIGKATTRTDQLFIDNIVLFECLRDSTPVTNNQVTVKENHPYDYPTTVSNYEHNNIGTLIENNTRGANITLNGTQKIQINGADVMSDHGLETTIPDSAGVGVTWIKMYTDGAGKWARQNSSDTFTGFYNNAGTPTALGVSKFGVYTLYVSKDTLNSTTPTYFAVLDTSQYNSLSLANTAISNGTIASASNELRMLEIAQLGYIVYSQASNSIVQVTISKATLKQTLSTSGTNTAALVNTSTASFNGWLSAANTNVQSSLDTLDDVLIGGTSGQIISSNGAATQPTYTTATYPKTTGQGEMLYSNSQNTVISGNSLTGGFTFTASTASVERSVTITNTDNTNPTSAATLKLITGGDNAGDAKTQYSTTTTSWVTGIDNSASVPSADPYVISQGTTLGTNNVMSIATTGEVTFPLQSAFSAYLAATVLNKTGAGTVYQLGTDALTEIFDRNSDFVTSGTFTAPITGLYVLAATMNDVGNNASVITHVIQIVTSNRTYSAASRVTTGGIDGSAACCFICDMDAGDTAVSNAIAYGSAAGDTTDIYGAASFATGFQGYLLG